MEFYADGKIFARAMTFEEYARKYFGPDSLRVCDEQAERALQLYKGEYFNSDIEVPKLKIEKVENEMVDITKASMDELAAEIARRKENEQLHLDHPFYKRAQHYREIERYEQIIKGAHKYKEPFNPMSWTPRQLLQHAMQENVDQGHYIVGLYEWIEEMENQIANLKQENEVYKARGDAYSEQLKDVGRLTKFLVEHFPEAGNAGEVSVDVAIELLKNYRNFENVVAKERKESAELITKHNELGKYLVVHYPQMLNGPEYATEVAKRVMDAYRKDEDLHAKG